MDIRGLIVLDLDGTLRRPASGARYPQAPCDQVPMWGSQALLRRLQSAGYRCAGIDQVRHGHESLRIADAIRANMHTLELLPALSLIVLSTDFHGHSAVICGHHHAYPAPQVSEAGYYTKPGVGMLDLAARAVGYAPLRAIIGDCEQQDRALARAAGVPFFAAAEARAAPWQVVADLGRREAEIQVGFAAGRVA